MSSNRSKFTEEFKIEAVRQVTEKGYKVSDVSKRLGVSTHSLYQWRKRYALSEPERNALDDKSKQLAKLQAELKRVTEERDILKKAATYFAKHSQ